MTMIFTPGFLFTSRAGRRRIRPVCQPFYEVAIDIGGLIEEITMNTRAMAIIAVSILAAACSNRKSNNTLTLTLDKGAAKAFADKHNATDLATQLENIHYPATVTIEGETVCIRVSQAPIRDVRRAVCHRI